MIKEKIAPTRTKTPFAYYSLRNISCPEDTAEDRKVYVGQAPLESILDIPTDANVRNYLVDAEGKQRRSYTYVHKAIRTTLLDTPRNFSILNSGITIVARDLIVDEQKKIVTLINPSIINGSQTQGVIKDQLNDISKAETIHVKFEIIVTDDEDLIAEISIARNYQNDVMTISIAGRRGQFDELEKSIKAKYPDRNLRKSESVFVTEDIVDTEKLLQVITALIPNELWIRPNEGDTANKVYTYSMKSRCLKEFQDVYEKKDDVKILDREKYEDLYKFYLDIAPYAIELYEKWKKHQGFAGTGLRSIERDGREIVDVPDGIIFPILASLSVFCTKKPRKGWHLDVPPMIEKKLISTAVTAYKDIAKSNPQTMGKNKGCYSSLLNLTSMYQEFVAKL